MIERRLENLLALDYPPEKLEIVVASDASSDRTNELVEAVAAREPRVRLLDCPRGGKVAAQDRAVRETDRRGRRVLRRERALGARRAPAARRRPRRPRGRLRLRPPAARGRRRVEPRGPLLALRALAAGAGVPARLGHRAGTARSTRCAASATSRSTRNGATTSPSRTGWCRPASAPSTSPTALAFEQPTPTNETEYARKVRMFEHCWEITLRGSMLRAAPARLPRRDGLAPRSALRERRAPSRPRSRRASRSRRRAGRTRSSLLGHLALLAAFAARVPLARYYVYVTWATAPGALELPAPRRARRLGSRGDALAVSRKADIR